METQNEKIKLPDRPGERVLSVDPRNRKILKETYGKDKSALEDKINCLSIDRKDKEELATAVSAVIQSSMAWGMFGGAVRMLKMVQKAEEEEAYGYQKGDLSVN